MPSRSRSSSSKSSSESAKRVVAARAASQTETTASDSDGAAQPVPEVRLLGTLQPAPSREERIAISAYWRAAQRQFAPGGELDDWLAAEREVDSEHSASR